MAARENQGYLIAIILLVLLTVILAILTYFAFSQAGAASSNLKEREKLLATANSRLTAYEQQAAILKAYVGIPPFDPGEVEQRMRQIQNANVSEVATETSAIRDQFNADMARYIRPTADGVEKTYRGLVDDMSIALMATHRERVTLNATVEVAEEDKREAIRKKDEEIKLVTNQLDASRSDLNTERELHNQTKKSLNDQLEAAKNANLQLNSQFARSRTEWTTEKGQLESDRSKAETRAKGLEEKLAKYEIQRYDVVDGRVLRVANSMNRVYVDIGSADNLQLRQSFAIYDQSLTTYERGMEKAKIEITNIIGPHSAEAQIIESSNVNPILTGDHVITATWQRGYRVPVALAGFFDLDDDGRSDLERLIGLISQNGGIVVAHHDETGQVFGKVNEDTRYIVMGQEPTNVEQIQGMSRIQEQAKDFVVQRIPLREFLNSMGVRSGSKVIPGTGTLDRGSRFPERRPPVRNGGSAFEN